MAHEFQMPEAFRDRVQRRQGRLHSVTNLVGPQTALVVVDMQRYFMGEGFPGECPEARQIVPTVNRLAAAVRGAGGRVVWLRMLAPWDTETTWSAVRDLYSKDAAAGRWSALQDEADGAELWRELDVIAADAVVTKERYSAFIPGSSDIESQLDGVDTVLVAGVATNVCCESTARDAMMLNYRVVMVSDACAAATDEEHAASLGNFYLYFGDVQSADQLIGLLGEPRSDDDA